MVLLCASRAAATTRLNSGWVGFYQFVKTTLIANKEIILFWITDYKLFTTFVLLLLIGFICLFLLIVYIPVVFVTM